MTDDATQGDWQPLADQPVLPEETSDEIAAPRDPDVVWAQPLGGAPGLSPGAPTPKHIAVSPSVGEASQPPPIGTISQPPPIAAMSPPPSTALTGPIPPPSSAEQATVGPQGDYLESPPRRRPPVAGLVGLVVIGALILAGLAFAVSGGSTTTSSGSTSGTSGTSGTASQSAAPLPAGGSLVPYLLAPNDLGPATSMTLVPGGRLLSGANGVTLDFCGDQFASEKSRVERVQAQYDGPAGTASNEFVRYEPGGAAAAFNEIKKAVSTCGTGYQDSTGAVSHIQQPSGFTGLAARHVVVSFEQQVGSQGLTHSFWVTCVYQFDGDFFSGVYVYSADAAGGRQLAESLATEAAGHLNEAANGRPGTGGGVFTSSGPSNAPGLAA